MKYYAIISTALMNIERNGKMLNFKIVELFFDLTY